MPAIEDLQDFDLENAVATLWVFKGPNGPAAGVPTYTGHWVETTDAVDAILKGVVGKERGRIEEVLDYDLLVQNNEASALSITTVETHAHAIVAASSAETPARQVKNLRHLQNTKFYVIKLVLGTTIIHAVSKADAAWRTKQMLSTKSVFYQENRLTIDERPHFEIETSIDFFIVGDEIIILSKGRFESLLRYKQAHRDDFDQLRAEQDFIDVFVDLAPLTTHVGDNKIQLRRASAIRQKGLYKDDQFMQRLRQFSAQYGFNFLFDAHGKIVVTPDTCSEIITALLDHRLLSAFSENIYDVPSTTHVVI